MNKEAQSKQGKRIYLTSKPFKAKMKNLDPDWASKIWAALESRNHGSGSTLSLPVAALAVTGARPASLQSGIEFSGFCDEKNGGNFIRGVVKGAKIIEKNGKHIRGQDKIDIYWRLGPPAETHRPAELAAIWQAIKASPHKKITVQYGAEVISNGLRELSRELWPRRKTLVSGVCYRELLASTAKAAGITRAELAMAMGHISEVSQGKYERAGKSRGGVRPFTRAVATIVPKAEKPQSVRQLQKFISGEVKSGATVSRTAAASVGISADPMARFKKNMRMLKQSSSKT